MVYWKVSAVPLVTDWKVASTVVSPIFIFSTGEPVTVTASLKVTVAVTVSPAFRRLSCAPVDAVSASAEIVAAEVSIVTEKVLLATPRLPARSITSTLKL